jgi:hypothetical protein
MHNNYAKTPKSRNYFYLKCKYKFAFNNYVSIYTLIRGKKS